MGCGISHTLSFDLQKSPILFLQAGWGIFRKCQQEHRKINVGAYIAKALDGFFKDHHA